MYLWPTGTFTQRHPTSSSLGYHKMVSGQSQGRYCSNNHSVTFKLMDNLKHLLKPKKDVLEIWGESPCKHNDNMRTPLRKPESGFKPPIAEL